MKLSRLSVVLCLWACCAIFSRDLRAQTTNTAIAPVPRDAQWLARHEAFLKEGPEKNPDLVFLGDSITDGWRTLGHKVWEESIATNYNALNLGISGDRTQHILWRIENGEFDHIKPKLIVLLIGTNNSSKERGNPSKDRNTKEEVIEGVQTVVRSLRAKLPDTKILLLAIFPRGVKDDPIREKLRQINAAIAKLDDGNMVRFLDIGPKFLEPDGTLSKEIMPDLLHPNKRGYRIWIAAMQEQIKAMLK